MIKLVRVDHRLLHGQVAMAWTQSLDVDCMLIANDAIMKDDIRKTTLKLAKPNGVKLVMKNIEDSITALNSGVTDKYKLFIIVESIEDAVHDNRMFAERAFYCLNATQVEARRTDEKKPKGASGIKCISFLWSLPRSRAIGL